MVEYGGVIVTILFAAGVVALFAALTSVLGPKRPSPSKAEPFECGESATVKSGGVPAHFYLIGMLFIVFDVELAFLFPWAATFRKLGMIGFIEIAIFVFFILLGYFFAIRKGALNVR